MPKELVASAGVAKTRPPAKLNLFLELLQRRPDGYHEIDTVMVPIDWCDEWQLQWSRRPGIDLRVDWIPSRESIAKQLGESKTARQHSDVLTIPRDDSNLVHRALVGFQEAFQIEGGFCCRLGKSIPAGAGMGGASSDAASALRCAAALFGIPPAEPRLYEIAAGIGSDIPFFLGIGDHSPTTAIRATGRGERLERVELSQPLHFVVVYPGVIASTKEVYANCQVPPNPQGSHRFIEGLQAGDRDLIATAMLNRLTEPAKKVAPQINEILESLWRLGLRTCQLTGSGSACFAIASSLEEAERLAHEGRATLEPGAMVRSTRSIEVPARVDVT